MAKKVVVIGGGVAGLVAAVACAEAGARVTLYEAHRSLGGRGRAIGGPYLAHTGGHVFYADDPNWAWLRERGLVGALGRPALRDFRTGFVRDGRMRALPPAGFVRMMATGPATAPVDVDFHTWASARYGERTARAAANAISVVTYDADTGRLSAAFVWNLLRRVFALRVPSVRWVAGGWQAVIDRLAARARDLGVAVELGARVHELPDGPVIVATELSSARLLLGDPGLRWESGDCVLFDLAVRSARGDRFVAWDLDAGGFHETYSMQDPAAAPDGETLFQLQMPIRRDEGRAGAARRVEALADLAVPGWRERTTWRRSASARHRGGALDLPGLTWRDRPAVDRGDGVFLAGDMVAAPGMRGEISVASALRAAGGALLALHLTEHATR
ncbi:phytoene dehydrogenase-like protein [Nonomuraea fuscirosea]|uniref:Phytoene dehydrogenase-like protein n=1 Tax=Nonomuraea fuscirosea TaxID=1291556 RepID=A0A2T0N865_9ACTN|nr:NAD(P)-binding protein [Nonomuraea fuscirosea]PRX68621.1 phytoene dehydrogenase-like protein [Nonomuraea fuscirosea]